MLSSEMNHLSALNFDTKGDDGYDRINLKRPLVYRRGIYSAHCN